MKRLFSQYVSADITAFFVGSFTLYDYLCAYKFFKLLALDQFLCSNKQDKGAVRGSEHAVNFIDPDVAILSRFLDRQRQLLRDRDSLNITYQSNSPSLKDIFQ